MQKGLHWRRICYCTISIHYCWNYAWKLCCRYGKQISIIKLHNFKKDWRPIFGHTVNDQIREHFDVQGQDGKLSQLWALQVDESTDSSGKVHLFAFIRFVENMSFLNQCLFCKELKPPLEGKNYLHWSTKTFYCWTYSGKTVLAFALMAHYPYKRKTGDLLHMFATKIQTCS